MKSQFNFSVKSISHVYDRLVDKFQISPTILISKNVFWIPAFVFHLLNHSHGHFQTDLCFFRNNFFQSFIYGTGHSDFSANIQPSILLNHNVKNPATWNYEKIKISKKYSLKETLPCSRIKSWTCFLGWLESLEKAENLVKTSLDNGLVSSINKSLFSSKQPKNNWIWFILPDLAFELFSSKSHWLDSRQTCCQNPRKGANPDPAPMQIIGTSSSSMRLGKWKFGAWRW